MDFRILPATDNGMALPAELRQLGYRLTVGQESLGNGVLVTA